MPEFPGGAWFNPIARHLGKAYWAPDTGRVMAFTKGTDQEVGFLVRELGLEPGMRLLDAGCGPGRHSLELARRGLEVTGIDLSPDFVALAREAAETEDLSARFEVLDIRELAFADAFDAVICVCQGGFGLLGGDDDAGIVARLAAALRPGGRLALTAFSSYFALRFLEEREEFDARTGVLHERATVRDAAGAEREFDLWTTCFTAREIRLLLEGAGLAVDAVSAVAPGDYRLRAPDLDHPELLALARRPHRRSESGLSNPPKGQ